MIVSVKLVTQQSYPMGLMEQKVFDKKVWEINPDLELEKRDDH